MAATAVSIVGTDRRVRVRNPRRVALLDFFTLGVYGLCWLYMINRELAALGAARGTAELGEHPRRTLLALFPGSLLIVPLVVSIFNTCKRVLAAQRVAGQAPVQRLDNGLGFALLMLIPPLGSWYVQRELNKVWATEAKA